MNVLLALSLSIVAVSPDAPISARYPEGMEIFHCPFDAAWDENFDDVPDGWTRRGGRGYPQYVSIKINPEQTAPAGEHCLEINLDGGGAVAYSPPIRIGPLHSYVLEGYLRTKRLHHDRAYLSLTFVDEDRNRLETYYSEKIRDSAGWKKLRLGPIAPADQKVRLAVIGLHVKPGSRADLDAVVQFDDVWLARLPRISLSTNNRHHLFTDPSQITVTCTASGFTRPDQPVTFRLEDALGNSLAEADRRLKTTTKTAGIALSMEDSIKEPPALTGSTEWKPPIPGPGFYRVWVLMEGQKTLVHQRDLTIAVIKIAPSPANGEFGWTLPQGDKPLPLYELGQVISQAGINWVKYPLWYNQQTNEEQIQKLIRFSERLTIHGIHLVGLLHDPPDDLRKQFEDSDSLSAAVIFSAQPKVWYPSLETVMMRMATQVRWWQLGLDKDTSFVDYPNLATKIGQIKTKLDRVGYDVKLGFGWGWLNQLPELTDGQATWRFLALSTDPPLTCQELPDYLTATKNTKNTKKTSTQRWVVLEPLSRNHYTYRARVTDLVQRMMTAKIHKAEAVFIPEPFSTEYGLMRDDGSPGELLLPWRTTALMLAGTTFIDSVQLPNGSQNRIFARGDDVVMVVWNDTPQREVIYLGSDTRHVDLWGRAAVPAREGHRQVFEVGPLPTFITGVNNAITHWRQNFSFARQRIPSVFGRRHQNSLRLKNDFDRGVSGTVQLVPPQVWQISPQRANFRLTEGQGFEQTFQIALPYNASSGRHKVRVDLEVHSDQIYRFSIYRHIDVGLGDVYFKVATKLNDRGELEIEQHFVNDTQDPVSFRCHLYAPDRTRRKTEIIGLGYGRDVQTCRFPNGEELIGKTLWLRAEEIGGSRVLNHHFVAQR